MVSRTGLAFLSFKDSLIKFSEVEFARAVLATEI